MKKYENAVYIGRFQPFHNGHKYVIEEAKKIAENVIVLVGSANTSRSIKNPFTFEERVHMIRDTGVAADYIIGLDDYLYEENQWLTEVQDLVTDAMDDNPNGSVCIIGHTKDESSYYLRNFPQWDQVNLEHWESLNSTDIRNLFFEGQSNLYFNSVMPDSVVKFLTRFKLSDKYLALVKEYEAIAEYKRLWAGSPFEPTFNTVDAVVIQSGHVLLIKRGNYPGKGLWALPGGFLGSKETLRDAMIRELREETKLKVPVPVLRGSIKAERTFDNPTRSTRGRTISQAFLIQLDNAQELPKVKGSDDAIFAKWFPLSQFYEMSTQLYEDHGHIVRKLLDNT